jgi:hypothetical protein
VAVSYDMKHVKGMKRMKKAGAGPFMNFTHFMSFMS